MSTATLSPHLKQLESEAIYVLREVAAQFERPVLLFSGGKDSIVLVELAWRAFAPGRVPFPAASHRHRPQLSRDAGLPRRADRAHGPAPDRTSCGGLDSPGARARGGRAARQPQRPPDGDAARRAARNWASTGRSAGRAATRRRRAPRSASSRTATASASGSLATSAPNSGTSSTGASTWASTSASSH